MAVAFAAGAHEFYFEGVGCWVFITHHLNLRRPKILENAQMRLFSEFFLHQFGHTDAAAHHHHVDVFRRAFEEDVAHVAAHHIAFHAELVGTVANQVENLAVEYLGQFLVAI